MQADSSTGHRQESSLVQRKVVHNPLQETYNDQDAAKLARSSKKLAAMLSAATTIQETLQLASQRQTQLLKDLTALQNDLALISHGHDGSLTDDSELGLFGDGHSIPGIKSPVWFTLLCVRSLLAYKQLHIERSNACPRVHKHVPLTTGSCTEKGSVNSKDKAWASGFEQLAVQFVHAEVTALHAMHPSKIGGLALFAVAGTADGVLHFLDAQGNAVAKHDTGV